MATVLCFRARTTSFPLWCDFYFRCGVVVVWMWCRCRVGVVWLWCGCGVVVVWMWCGCGVGVVWVWMWCGCGVGVVWLWCGCGVDVVWMWCGCGVNFLGEGWHLRATICSLLRIQFTSFTQIKPSQAFADGFWTHYKYSLLTYLCSKLSGVGECLNKLLYFSLVDRIFENSLTKS